MKKFLMALAVLCIASPAIAGPNLGGTLVVHDTGIHFSTPSDLPIPPQSAAPTGCPDGVDNSLPVLSSTDQVVWKVYAAFPNGSSPRVKGLAWGIAGTGSLYVTGAGLPDPPNCFQVVQGSWPSPPGSIGQSFVFPQTSQFVECYWFGGYGYLPAVFSTAPHQTNETLFVDDAVPGNTDPIAGFSSIGFGGGAGVTVCPVPPDTTGACCHPDQICELLTQDACLPPNVFFGGDCVPNPCPPPPVFGACCLADHSCIYVTHAECDAVNGTWTEGVQCTPNFCTPPNPTEATSWGHIKANYR